MLGYYQKNITFNLGLRGTLGERSKVSKNLQIFQSIEKVFQVLNQKSISEY
jgi:hypothetical protein